MPRSRIALETGMHSPWVSRLLSGLGHEVIVAHAKASKIRSAFFGFSLEAQRAVRLSADGQANSEQSETGWSRSVNLTLRSEFLRRLQGSLFLHTSIAARPLTPK